MFEFELWETYPTSGRPARLVQTFETYHEALQYVAERSDILPYAAGNWRIVGGDTGEYVTADEDGYLYFAEE